MEEELDNLDRSRRTYLAQMRTLIARQLSEVEASDSQVVASTLRDQARLRHPALAKESFDICSEALEMCDAAAPMYVLLLNHCVYVATVARVSISNLSDLVRQLIGQRLQRGEYSLPLHTLDYRQVTDLRIASILLETPIGEPSYPTRQRCEELG